MHRWLFFKNALVTNASLLQVIVCQSAMGGTLSSMSQENARAPGLAFSTIEIVALIECIVMASLSSTRCGHHVVFVGHMIEEASSTPLPLSDAYAHIWH